VPLEPPVVPAAPEKEPVEDPPVDPEELPVVPAPPVDPAPDEEPVLDEPEVVDAPASPGPASLPSETNWLLQPTASAKPRRDNPRKRSIALAYARRGGRTTGGPGDRRALLDG
jgi:protein TonB